MVRKNDVQGVDFTPGKQAKQKLRERRKPTVPTPKVSEESPSFPPVKLPSSRSNVGAASPTVSSIVRPEIFTFRIVGISPLLQNNPEAFIGKSDSDDLSTKIEYDDEKEAALRVYRHKTTGLFYHPTQGFINAMIRAVSGMKFGKVFATSAIRGSVFAADHCTYLLDGKGREMSKYEIDRQPVAIGKSRILRCRPIWKEWQVNLSLDVDTALIGEKQARAALELAGRRVGVGDYRPEKGGGFGRFRVA